jgi:hypothetical protein
VLRADNDPDSPREINVYFGDEVIYTYQVKIPANTNDVFWFVTTACSFDLLPWISSTAKRASVYVFGVKS